MMMDEIIKNDFSQPDSTFRICDTDHEAELQDKKQTRKITM
jgi:hypothetical protein